MAQTRRERRDVASSRGEAFMRRALDAHGDAVYRLALARTGSAADAQDVAQDVFMRLLVDQTDFHDDDHLRAWLLRVTINRCRELWRTPWERRVTSADEPAGLRPDERPGPEEVALRSLEADPVWKALAKLPDPLRDVANLHYVEGMAPSEIARVLGCPAATVRTRLFRARAHLRRELGVGQGGSKATAQGRKHTEEADHGQPA